MWWADQCARLAGTVYWSGMRVSPSGLFWNKLGTFLWILEYDLQLGREVVQYYDPQNELFFFFFNRRDTD